MHVHGKHESSRDEERLDSHRWGATLLEIYFTLTTWRNPGVVCKIFWNEHGALEGTWRHAISFELCVRVWEVLEMELNLLRPKNPT